MFNISLFNLVPAKKVFVFGVILVPIFLTFTRIWTEYGGYSVSLRIQSKCSKMQEKCGPEELRIRTPITQWVGTIRQREINFLLYGQSEELTIGQQNNNNK